MELTLFLMILIWLECIPKDWFSNKEETPSPRLSLVLGCWIRKLMRERSSQSYLNVAKLARRVM